jgi:hypothetical protein
MNKCVYLCRYVDGPEDPVDELDVGPLGGEEEAALGVGLGNHLLVLQQGLGIRGPARRHQRLACNSASSLK